jgi:type I restriction enzyme S subunit
MSPKAQIDLDEPYRALVLEILTAHLPNGAKVYVFGSRAREKARRMSDLDLAIDAGRRLSTDERVVLREAFSESDLPFKVDIVDWQAIEDPFRELIDKDRVKLVF